MAGKKERVIVTGGAGFIGSWLCNRLVEEDYSVICVDNIGSGRRKNIEHLLHSEKFEFIEHDVKDPIKIDGLLGYIFHMASRASPVDFQKYAIDILLTNSLGTRNALELAKEKNARFLLASSSEVYGDPLEHPQRETYRGNVNPVGPRSCYDEAKRFAEALVMAFHRDYGLDVRIARIFNSILADESVIVFNDQELHLGKIGEYVEELEKKNERGTEILVPSFDSKTYKISLRKVSAVIKHPCVTECYELCLRYGRRIKVTGDHSVFKEVEGKPVAVPVRDIKVGEHVAIPAKLPVIEKDVQKIVMNDELIKHCPEKELWDYAITSPKLEEVVQNHREEINEILEKNGRFRAKNLRNAIMCASNKYMRKRILPLFVLNKLKLTPPYDARVRVYKGGAHIYIPNQVEVTNNILWLIGFFIAEGSSYYEKNGDAFISLSSDEYLLKKAEKILNELGIHVVWREAEKWRSPSIYAHSKVLYFIFDKVFNLISTEGFPSWILQLPLRRLKYVLEGYREGDGTHSGKKIGKELCFDSKSEKMANDLTLLLLRFGIVASVGKYNTTFKRKYGKRKFPFYRVTVCEVSNFNLLEWDKGITQSLNARRVGDLVWAKVLRIKRSKPTEHVYDFSVPGAENFVAGNGVFAHNTYGPRMRKDDGRAIPNFITQALESQPITVHGDGSQTRSFCYITDMVGGLMKLMFTDDLDDEIVNLGNPDEVSILEIANLIKKMTNSSSKIAFKPLPRDDPARRKPDISKAKKLLGWNPTTSLEEGLRRTIEYSK